MSEQQAAYTTATTFTPAEATIGVHHIRNEAGDKIGLVCFYGNDPAHDARLRLWEGAERLLLAARAVLRASDETRGGAMHELRDAYEEVGP